MFQRQARSAKKAFDILKRSYTSGLGFESTVQAPRDLRGKTFLVTGSTSGIGNHTATLLAQQGATVLVHGRALQRVKKVIKALRTDSGNKNVFGYCQDLSSVAGTRALAAHVSRDLHQFFGSKLHCLINNAGVFMEEKETTEDGLEMTWAVNTAAPFLLTAELLPLVTNKIINNSSISLADSIDLYNTQQERGYERSGHAAYGMSKLAVNMWSYKLADDLKAAGSHVTVNCVDPGTVGTKLLYAGWGEMCADVALQSHEADDIFWAATDPGLDNVTGHYYVNRKARSSPTVSYDKEMQKKLWELLENQTGAKYNLIGGGQTSRPFKMTPSARPTGAPPAQEKATLHEIAC